MHRDVTKMIFDHHNIPTDHWLSTGMWEHGYRFIAVEDNICSLSKLEGDTFKPENNPDLSFAELKKSKKDFRAHIESEGVWGFGLGKIDNNGVIKKIYSTFIWGFVGNAFIGSGYDDDLIKETMEILGKVH